MDIVVAAKAAGTVVRFVEGGPLAEALAELNVKAALSALNKAKTAEDRRAQVWSAVNHLEGAQAALDSKIFGARGKAQLAFRVANWYMLMNKRKYVLALMSICYRYLGEETLAQQALELVRAETEPYDVAGWGIYLLGHTAAVINVIGTVRWELDEEKYPKDWSKFELPPRGLPSSGGLFTEDP